MKNIIKILFLLFTLVTVTSCLGVRKTSVVSGRPMNADLVRLDLKMEDFQLLGEENVSIIYRKYIGISNMGLFTVIDSINGVPVERRNVKTVQFNAISPFNTLLSRAMSPLIEKYPDVDFVTPVYTTTESNFMFGGSKNKLTAKVKLYKFKSTK